jgi:uncharacterized damage-inducible protein DinB
MSHLLELRAAARARCPHDHAGIIRSYYPFWDAQYRPYLLAAVDALPVEQFDFKPRPDMLTARQVVVHIAEAEAAWNRIIDRGPEVDSPEWVAPADDPAQGFRTLVEAPDHAALQRLLAGAHEATRSRFDRPAGELGRVLERRFDDGVVRTYTVHWILDHVQEHEIHHRSQLNLYLRMLGIEPPSI